MGARHFLTALGDHPGQLLTELPQLAQLVCSALLHLLHLLHLVRLLLGAKPLPDVAQELILLLDQAVHALKISTA